MLLNRNHIKYKDLVLRKFRSEQLKAPERKECRGLDTETLDGYCRLLCDDMGNYLETKSLDEILAFLTSRRFRETHNFFYNLKYDVQAIIKYLSRKELELLYEENRVSYKDYLIKWIPGKIFGLVKSKHSYGFYDVAQFYGGSLEYNAETYLGLEKNEDNLDRAQIGTSKQYWKDHREEIIKYCISDSLLCRYLGDHLEYYLSEEIGITPWKFVSKAGISKDYFRSKAPFPHTSQIPKGVLSMYLQAYTGGRFEVLQKGAIAGCHSVDLCSAYPKQIAELPDIREGEWKKVREHHEQARLGVYLVRVYVPPSRVAPLPVRLSRTLIAYPCGEFMTFITKQEYEAYQDDIELEVIRGWEYYESASNQPYGSLIGNLYGRKASTDKANFTYDLIKIIMNSLYGAFYEKVKQEDKFYVGKLFNPVYATEVTGGTRAALWPVLRPNRNHVVTIATDGVMLTRKPDIPFSKDLGAWDYDAHGDALVIRSGLYKIGETVKNRGLKSMKELETEHGQYKTVFHYIEDHPELEKYKIVGTRPYNLGECLLHHHKKDPSMINVWGPFEYTLDINTDLKRIWEDRFSCGGDLLDRSIGSIPIILGN